MGKQIRFFMVQQDEEKFLKVIKEFGDTIVDNMLQPFSLCDITSSTKEILNIISPESSIIKSKRGCIDSLFSDTIEFSRSYLKNQNELYYGRLWTELKYYNENREIVTKSKVLNDRYSFYNKWIKKNFKISDDKDFYIGEEAYKLYKEFDLRMMATPKTEVVFR